MVEEAVQHELDTLRKLVLELTARPAGNSNLPPGTDGPVTHERLAVEVAGLREYNATVRGLNTRILETRHEESEKAKILFAQEVLRRFDINDDALAALKSAQQSSDEVVDQRAQAANDALERLLNAKVDGVIAISEVRHGGTQLAVTEVKDQVTSAFNAAQTALTSALAAAKSEVEAVDQKSFMRCDKLEQQIKSQKDLIDLGNAMSKEAITKAETSQDRRLDSMNEFRGQMSDMQSTLMSRVEAEARFSSMGEKLEILKAFSAKETGKSEGYGYVIATGLAGLAIIVTVVMGVYVASSHQGNSQMAGADTNRVSDLIANLNSQHQQDSARMDALSARINGLTPPLIPAVPPR